MWKTIYLVRTALLAGIGLLLAACAATPASYGYYGPSGYYGYYGGPPVYGTVDFAYGGGWHHGWDHGWHPGHFAHGFGHGFAHGFAGHGFAHVGGGGHRG